VQLVGEELAAVVELSAPQLSGVRGRALDDVGAADAGRKRGVIVEPMLVDEWDHAGVSRLGEDASACAALVRGSRRRSVGP
jgi:hypothetical protein